MSTQTNKIDKAVGARIRAYRKARGMSQSALAEKIGVRFQQVQKYENGVNRVAASRLWQIADAFHVDIIALFQDVRQTPAKAAEIDELMTLFNSMPTERRKEALAYMRTLASSSPAPLATSNKRYEPAG